MWRCYELMYFYILIGIIHTIPCCGRREQTTGPTNPKMFKNITILKCLDFILNHHVKWNQISTNMPAIGSLIRETAVKKRGTIRNLRKQKMLLSFYFLSVKIVNQWLRYGIVFLFPGKKSL